MTTPSNRMKFRLVYCYMKRFSKPLNKVDLSSPVFLSGTNGFSASIKRLKHADIERFFYHLTSKRPRFRRSGRSENNTGGSEIRQKLNNWIKTTYVIGA